MNRFSVAPLHTMTRELAAVASGRLPPDTILTGARLASTYTERMLDDRELWLYRGRIAALMPAGSTKRAHASATEVIDVQGGILAPGLVDPHLHIESSMMTACAYAEPALLNGTTTIFCDSHEIANVCDVAGVEWMLEDARHAALNVFLTIPSTVPALPARYETAGGELTAAKIGSLFDRWPEAVALGEKMDFVQLCAGDAHPHAIVQEALQRGRPVSGHVYGREFVAAYAASGVTDTHEAVTREIADDLLEAGVWVFLRSGPPGTPWHSLPQAIRAVTELGAHTKRICLCTDDRDADDLFHFGMDYAVHQAVAHGLSPLQAWSLGSLHGATRFGMEGEIGGFGGGRRADLVLLNDAFEVQNTWFGGALVVKDKQVTSLLDRQLSEARFRYPEAAYRTVILPAQARLTPELPSHPCRVNVIRTVSPSDIALHPAIVELHAAATWEEHLDRHGLCFLSVLERHGKSGAVAHGLLQGFGISHGAVASSVGHDAHNIIVAGRTEAEMRLAVETIRIHGGGVVVVTGTEVKAVVPLPIAGLLSDARATEVATLTAQMKHAWDALGCRMPYMGFSLISLSVIPEIRLTDKGLVTVPEMQQLPLICKEEVLGGFE